MTRLTYQAPGVYVEEIPSARQPIAGVGTNTAAFIGIDPDTIYYPVANNNYDPVAARDALKKIRNRARPLHRVRRRRRLRLPLQGLKVN